MKNRSHRLPISDPLDDWVDGSWTVDCVCGVNFDDGEEMVNCDECGVWVHTRCSRYVKSEKLFACDKCKSKSSRNDSEETEVAQLLVELPTKTLRMENPNPSFGREPPRRPFRLWTDIPKEERVHVQGVPGGDTALFGGLSSVFSPELWKCTGHVPKKLNFQYREFPCWDEKKEDDKKTDEENENLAKGADFEDENPANKGAGVLFSLSKENGLPNTPMTTFVGMRRQVGEGGCERKKKEGDDLNVRRPHNGVKKDKSSPRSIVIHSGKRKKEDLRSSKDQGGKKKSRSVDKDGDSKKRGHNSKSVPTLSSDAKLLEFYEDRGSKVVKAVAQSSKHGNSRDAVPADSLLDSYRVVDKDAGEPEKSLAFSGQPSQTLASIDISRNNSSSEARPKEENAGARLEISPKTDNGVASLLEHNDSGSVPIKEEVGDDRNKQNDNKGSSGRSEEVDQHKSESLTVDPATAAPEVKDDIKTQDSNGDTLPNSSHPNLDSKSVVDIGSSTVVSSVQSTFPGDSKMDSTDSLAPHISSDHLSENVKVIDSGLDISKSSDLNTQVADKNTVISDCQTDNIVGKESSSVLRKSSSELKHGSGPAEEPPSKSARPPSQHKMVISVGKSSSTSSTVVISKPSASDTRRHSSSTKSKKDNPSTDKIKNDDGRERPKKLAKEQQHTKSSSSSVLKASHSSKIPHFVSKRSSTDPKESVVHSLSKTSSVQNVAPAPESGETASSLQTETAVNVENKITALGLPQRGGKMNHSNSQPSAKANHTPPMHPPAPLNSHANLSDEELALLLHQELNSSPRVPRVPRMRHTGSLPQLASPTATSTLMKRTSSSGGKDHALVLRRKNKDLAKDGSRNSREAEDESKKVDRVTSSSDRSKHDTADLVTKGESENGSVKGSQSVGKSIIPPASTTTASSGPSSSTEANEQNMSSTRSPQNASDDETGTVGRPTTRTLPGLIADIMSKGKRMTYEELCNAVLPHWPNLRKHNGERYAYSSHSQAVLDCLRNRSEWARLVDRGPKTNASRKRRKPDAEHSEDNEYTVGKEVESSKSLESHREKFPQRKRRQVRKRRRLSRQGTATTTTKDVRRRHKAKVVSDDDDDDDEEEDSDSFSNSTEEVAFSEDDEIQGGSGGGAVEASASSDETENML